MNSANRKADIASNTEQHLVVTGNPVDGLFFYGPFSERDAAVEWAEAECDGDDWWIAPLVSKEHYEAENAV